ncbi:MAG: serine/threonine protein kinase [Deltaproteobacteria bacterium]|nr:serine/threonine protein kinase [Deltaproteobacteria bacterium]
MSEQAPNDPVAEPSVTPRPPVDPLIGCTLAGRYQVQALIGVGGVARVYRAIQLPMGRLVALKAVRPELEPDQQDRFEARFLREAAMAGRLSHPNIVTVYDYGRTEDGWCFIAMELIQGVPLKRLMDQGPMNPARAMRLMLDVTLGLRHAHKRGMVHRDVKPGNITIVRDDEDQERARLLDFGLVKADEDTTITRSGAFMGTPHYIAPEQARGGDVDARADLYALGCVLYRLLTGVLPYTADNPMTIALAHLRSPYPPMGERAPGVAVPPEVEAVVRRLMEKEPADRYASAGELARVFQSLLGLGVVGEETEVSTLGQAAIEPSVTQSSNAPLVPAAAVEPDERRPNKRLGLWVGVGALFLAVGVGLGVVMLQRAERQPEPPAEPVVVAPPAPVEAPAEPAPIIAEPVVEAPVVEAPVVEAPAVEAPAQAPRRRADPKADPPPKAQAKPSGATIFVDDVSLSADAAARAVNAANTSSEADLRAMGLRGQQVTAVLSGRPYADIYALAATPYVGGKTLVSLGADR